MIKMREKILFTLYSLTFGILNSQNIKPEDTEIWDPEPKIVSPGASFRDAPSDAIVLFSGLNLNKWVHKNGEPARWDVKDGYFTVKPGSGSILSKDFFGSCQLHVEFMSPIDIEGDGQNRGNSGIYFQKVYEIQVLDSYDNVTYSNGQAASVYKQSIPLVNASRPPGEWQTYDIIFNEPVYDNQGKRLKKGSFIVFHNGILVQNNVEIEGTTEWMGKPRLRNIKTPKKLYLQEHNNPVSFRNIWLRNL